MKWLLLLLPLFAWADEGDDWSKRWFTVSEVVERHEGYQNNDVIKKPEGTWQLLYAVIRTEEAPAGLSKDCLWVKVPAHDDGELRIVAVHPGKACAGTWENPATIVMSGLKAIQSSQEGSEAKLWLTLANGRVLNWKVRFINKINERTPVLYDSSARARSYPGAFFFAPNSEITGAKARDLVGDITDEYPTNPCSFKDGSCQKCRWGVYQVASDYFCGIDRCGEKNQPACRRGKTWQRTRNEFSCRTDDSHIFCGPGLRVECEGERAICR